jgi:glycosyltransferase involved in cell wall biosynthesis
MKILMIGTDRKLFEEGSAVRARAIRYGEMVEELHIILFSKKNDDLQPTTYNLSPTVFVYPTYSRNRWWYILDGIRIGEKILKSLGGDWVFTSQDTAETGLVGWRLKKLFNAPFQLQVHTDIYSPYYKGAGLLNRIRVFFAQFLLPRADQIRVVSERIKKSLLARGIPENKIIVLPIFSPPTHYSLPSTHSAKPFKIVVLMVGRLEEEKNIADGLRAFSSISKKNKDAGLVIVGDGSLRSTLEKEAMARGIKEQVRFIGWVDDVFEYYKQADIFLHTSFYEGYGLVLIEAASYGLPIVSTDVGIVGDVLIENESTLVCAVGDVPCLSQHLSRLLTENELRGAIGASAKQAVQKMHSLTEEEYYKKQYELWQDCLQGQ